MELFIHESSKIAELQKFFNDCFPFLKIEFFDLEANKELGFRKENLITDYTIAVSEIPHFRKKGHLNIDGHQKISTLEEHFQKSHNLFVQVFRRSGNAWLQTTTSDDLTLLELNKRAKEYEQERNNSMPENKNLYK
jgi:hypothetical protein